MPGAFHFIGDFLARRRDIDAIYGPRAGILCNPRAK